MQNNAISDGGKTVLNLYFEISVRSFRTFHVPTKITAFIDHRNISRSLSNDVYTANEKQPQYLYSLQMHLKRSENHPVKHADREAQREKDGGE